MSTPMGCAPATSRDLRVYVINEAGAAQRTLDAAEAEVVAIWASAALRLVWTFPPAPLDVPDRPTVVVVLRRALSQPATVGAVDSQARFHPPLGQITFGDDGRPGNLIEVSFHALTSLVMSGTYFDRPISARSDLGPGLLGLGLGRVVAHEIGHWLMGRGHTKQGLMRPRFGVRDLVAPYAPRLPRTWLAAGSERRLALSSRCELDASHPGTGDLNLPRGARRQSTAATPFPPRD
jgi:hypothetical protein